MIINTKFNNVSIELEKGICNFCSYSKYIKMVEEYNARFRKLAAHPDSKEWKELNQECGDSVKQMHKLCFITENYDICSKCLRELGGLMELIDRKPM